MPQRWRRIRLDQGGRRSIVQLLQPPADCQASVPPVLDVSASRPALPCVRSYCRHGDMKRSSRVRGWCSARHRGPDLGRPNAGAGWPARRGRNASDRGGWQQRPRHRRRIDRRTRHAPRRRLRRLARRPPDRASDAGVRMADSVASSTPAASPRQPAWATPTSLPSSAANTTGRQSAVSTASTVPGENAMAASASGSSPSHDAASACQTRVPCTCRSQCGAAGRPARPIRCSRLASTSSTRSSVRRPRLRRS